jgi:lipopolysaccharide biosynthesis glycosyltransferase
MTDFKVFVGYDSREDIAWQVCRFSLERHARGTVPVHPLRQTTLRELGLYTRPVDSKASTEFSLTRFLTPYLNAAPTWSMFVDCDVLFTGDVAAILQGLDPTKAVYVVQHDYSPANRVKMDGKQQHIYPRKNWSSMMLFNGAHPDVQTLTPQLVNTAEPAFLHRFSWVKKDEDIGAVDLTWNYLEGEYPVPEVPPKAIHYTNGGPWFENWKDVAFGDLWMREKEMYEASLKAAA